MKEGTGGTEREGGGSGRRGRLCVSRGPPRELCSREPGHWGEVVRACLKQYTQGFSQSSHTQCARSMSLSQHSPAVHQHIQSNREKNSRVSLHTHAQRPDQKHTTNTDALTQHTAPLKHNRLNSANSKSPTVCRYLHGDTLLISVRAVEAHTQSKHAGGKRERESRLAETLRR